MKKTLKRIFSLIFYTLLLTILVTLVVGLIVTLRQHTDSNGDIVFVEQQPEEGYIFKKVAYISGQVTSPGIYEITDSTRLSDLISKAGGFTNQADSNYIAKELNLSEVVKDEEHIYIPAKSENETNTSSTSPDVKSDSTSTKINLNTATSEQLQSLPGIGPSTAAKIISARPFESVEDLLNVSGIGDTKYNQVKDLVTVQ